MPPTISCRLLQCWLLTWALAGPVAAETSAQTALPVQRLPVNGALTQNSITTMLQDRSGLMWFATLGGVNVYDGYEFIPSSPRYWTML